MRSPEAAIGGPPHRYFFLPFLPFFLPFFFFAIGVTSFLHPVGAVFATGGRYRDANRANIPIG